MKNCDFDGNFGKWRQEEKGGIEGRTKGIFRILTCPHWRSAHVILMYPIIIVKDCYSVKRSVNALV